MALPATSTNPQTPSYPLSQPNWLAEHTQPTHRNTPHGQKRRSDEVDDLEDRPNNISTNFKRLRINNSILPSRPSLRPQDYPKVSAHPDSHASITSHPAYLPPSVQSLDDDSFLHHPRPSHSLQPSHHPHHQHVQSALQTHLHPLHAHLSPNRDFTHTPPPAPYLHPPSRTSTATSLSDEPMTLDAEPSAIDSKDKVVITDLSAELAEIEALEQAQREREQEQAFFLPEDYEREISGVPAHVLNSSSNHVPAQLNGSGTGPGSQALILYKDPSSISVPEEEDAVRKAVVDARRRMRERQQDQDQEQEKLSHTIGNGDGDIDLDHDSRSTAEPYIRNGLAADDGLGRFGRDTTPFPLAFPNLNLRQPRMSGPYIPINIDIDDDINDIRQNNHIHAESNGGGDWDEDGDGDRDAMDIE